MVAASPEVSRMGVHEQRVAFLGTLADLIGCSESIGGQLPDGRRPDVLRIDRSRGGLFVGDAKNWETPGCHETQCRLARYIEWLATHVAADRGPAVLALCFVRMEDAARWEEILAKLEAGVGLVADHRGLDHFDDDIHVLWHSFQRTGR